MKKLHWVLTGLVTTGLMLSYIGCANAGNKAAKAAPPPKMMAQTEQAKMPPPDADKETEELADRLMTEGVNNIVSGDYPKALKLFMDILGVIKNDHPMIPTTYYNIACTYALMNEKAPTMEYLAKAIKSGYDNRQAIDADPDLAAYRGTPEYKEVMALIPAIVEITPTPEDEMAQKEALNLIATIRGIKYKEEPKYKIMAPDQFQRAYGGGRDSDTILGFYRWDDKTLYLKQGLDPVKFKGTRIHETFHALQDQLFGTGDREKTKKTIDQRYAFTALIEGDATLTFIECMPESMAKMMIKSAAPWRMMGPANYDGSKQGEAAMRMGAFGYSTAARFVKAIKDAQGWEGVNAMYANPPASTEQVLHADKYMAQNDPPVKVTVADLSSTLGADWKNSETDTQGEFVMGLQLMTTPKSGPLAEEAAAGWGGDTYVGYFNASSRQMFVIHKSVWDSAKDADEYFESLSYHIEREYAPEKGDNFVRYNTPENTVDYIAKKGNQVLAITNIPKELFDKVLAVLGL
ncbi:MAG: hypothetical protein WC980_06480 [Candidatus Brocadiia bacterium]